MSLCIPLESVLSHSATDNCSCDLCPHVLRNVRQAVTLPLGAMHRSCSHCLSLPRSTPLCARTAPRMHTWVFPCFGEHDYISYKHLIRDLCDHSLHDSPALKEDSRPCFFTRNCWTASSGGCPVAHPHSRVSESQMTSILGSVCVICHLNSATVVGGQAIQLWFYVAFPWWLMMLAGFSCLYFPSINLLWWSICSHFCPLKKSGCMFSYFSVLRVFLYILDVSPLSDTCIAHIFSSTCGLPFSSLYGS